MILNDNNPSDKRIYPSRWEYKKGKHLFSSVDNRSEEGKEELLTVSHITGITPRKMKTVSMFKAESLVGYKICEINDIAANTMWMWQGAIGVSKYRGVISPSYNVYRQKNDDFLSDYLDLLLREPTLVDVYHSLSTGIRPSRLRLYPEQLFSIDFPVPSKEEQQKIVDYLEWKISKINALINNFKKQVCAINEEKQVELSSVFTKGIAGIHTNFITCTEPVIGSVPDGWKVMKLKYVCKMYNGDSISDSEKDDYTTVTETPYIATKDVDLQSATANYENGLYVPENSAFKIAPKNSTLLCIEGGSAGRKKAYITRDVAFVNKLCAFVATDIDSRFLFYFLSSNIFGLQFKKEMTGLIGGVSIGAIKRLLIPVPKIEEQKEIVNYLDNKCEVLDKTILLIQKKISVMIELRQSLISDVVTGKIDVRNIDIPQYEHIAEIDSEYEEFEDEEDNVTGEEE